MSDTSPPSKRRKTETIAAVAADGNEIPLVFKLALSFCDKETLLFKLSEVSKSCKNVAMNEIVRRFHKTRPRDDDDNYGDIVSRNKLSFKCNGEVRLKDFTMFGCPCDDADMFMFGKLRAAHGMPQSLGCPDVQQWIDFSLILPNIGVCWSRDNHPSDLSLTSPRQFQDGSTLPRYDKEKVLARLEQQGEAVVGTLKGEEQEWDEGFKLAASLTSTDTDYAEVQQQIASQQPLSILFQDNASEALDFFHHGMANGKGLELDGSTGLEGLTKKYRTTRLAIQRLLQYAMDNQHDYGNTKPFTVKQIKLSSTFIPAREWQDCACGDIDAREGHVEDMFLYFEVPFHSSNTGTLHCTVPLVLNLTTWLRKHRCGGNCGCVSDSFSDSSDSDDSDGSSTDTTESDQV